MEIGFQRKMDRIAGTFICRIFSLFSKRRKCIPGEVNPKEILVILLSEMGSLVLACPMFDRIKAKYPSASIHVLVFEQNREMLEVIDIVPSENIMTVSNISLMKCF